MKFHGIRVAALARPVSFLILAMCLVTTASARRTAIDFDSSAIELDGQSFSSDTTHCGASDTAPSSCRANLFGDKSAGPIRLGFSIRIGTENFNSFFINEAGIITFGSALSPSGSFTAVANFAGLQAHVPQPFIAAFYANLQTVDGTAPSDPFSVSSGGVLYGRGSADPVAPFNVAGLLPAAHVGWIEDVSFDPFVATQVVIYYTGSTTDADATNDGDFAIRIRYGTKADDSDVYNNGGPPTGIAGFSFGSGTDSHDLGSPLRAADDYYFTFHNGHLGSGAQTTNYKLTPQELSFGNQAVGTSSSARSFTLTNTGTTALPIGVVEIKGTDRSLFTSTNTCGTSIAIAANCRIDVTFTPTTTGAKSARVRVVAGDGLVKTGKLTGAGTGASVSFSVSPTSLAFGEIRRNHASASRSVKVKNTGTQSLPIKSITLGGSNPGDFSRTHNCPGSLAAGATCTVNVVFRPTSRGAKTATLIVTPNGAAAKSVSLTGKGT